jgi:heavy metal sensor kinase
VLDLPKLGPHGAHAVASGFERNGKSLRLVVTAPLDTVAADLAAVRRILWFAMPPLVALAALGGWWLASRNVAPLSWMAVQAAAISGSSLEKRLEIGKAAGELSLLAASFNELLARLDHSFNSMRRFVADASHEMRTPIAIVQGEAEVALSRDRTPAEYQASLGLILDESRRLSRLVDDLLHLARADAGHVKLRREEFYLNDLVAECCRSLHSLAAARQIDLECRPASDAPIHGDPELLRRLVVNLLDNAIRYTEPGGKARAAVENTGPDLRITISDSGPGVPADAAPYLFDRFYRADKSRDRERGGSGLGLAIVKWIAESHGGTVTFASQPGAGTTFTVTLPR